MFEGRPLYATALGQTDTPAGWRAGKSRGGCLIDIPNNRTVASGFLMPHSPRFQQGRVWLLDSGTGRLVEVDVGSSTSETIAVLPGYTRGLCFAGPYAFVGLSKIRETSSLDDVPIAANRQGLKSGVAVIELASGRLVGMLEFNSGIHELFAVKVLPGVRCPAISGPFVAKDGTQPVYVMPQTWIPGTRAEPSRM